MPHKDENESAAEIVRKLTGTEPVDGADGIADPETRRKFLEMKEREARRKQESATATSE